MNSIPNNNLTTLNHNKIDIIEDDNILNNDLCPPCSTYYKCDPIKNICIHKGFFPLYPLELLQVIATSTVSLIATSVGIGGIFILLRWYYTFSHFNVC